MKTQTKRILLLLCVLLLVVGVYLFNRPRTINVTNAYSDSDVPTLMEEEQGDLKTIPFGYEEHVENDFLALYVNPDKSYFAVHDKRNDYTWTSATTKFDPLVKTNTQRILQQSTFSIQYLQEDNTVASMSNYEYSIAYKDDFENAFNITYLDDGYTVTYTMRNREPRGYWFPAYISKDRFLELVYNPVQQFGSTFDKRNIDQYYGPLADDPDTYVIRQISKDEETNEFDMSTLSGAQVQTLFKLFYEIGHYGNKQAETGEYIEEYTLEDVEFDNQQYNIFTELTEPEFQIPLTVRLLEDRVDVSVDFANIISKNDFEIVSLTLLPYMGAANTTNTGYLVIPEGSGGIINFNNGKYTSKSYSSFIYEEDNVEVPDEISAKDIGSHLPIFGIKTEQNAMLGIINNGTPHAKVSADVSKKYDSYNKAYSTFYFKQAGRYQLAENNIQLWNEEQYRYSPSISYYFFDDDDANYTSMASLYGKYIEHKYRLNNRDTSTYPFMIDFIGSYDYDDFFLWFPVTKTGSMTSYEQAQTIMDELSSFGIDQQVVRYRGWFNGGIKHAVPNDIDLDRALGNKRDLRAFMEYMEAHNYPLYFDVDFTKTYESSMFYTTRNYSRVIGGDVAKYYEYDPSSNQQMLNSDPYYLSNVSAIDRNTTRFLRDARRLNLPGISFRYMGNMIYSDYLNNNQTSRALTRFYYQDIMAKFNQESVMLEHANDYLFPFASYITDLDARTSKLVVVDEMIPFYQIAIAPYIPYSLPSFNHGDIYEESIYLLKAIETGSHLKTTLTHDNTSELLLTDFNEYMNTTYSYNQTEIRSMYEEASSLAYSSSFIVKHTVLENGLIEVEYDNGALYYINYYPTDLVYNGITVGSESYEEIEVD